MTKRILASLILVVLAAALVSAAPAASFKGKITAIDGKKVTIELIGDKADWAKKGATVKFQGGVGRIAEIVEKTISFNSKQAAKLKVGDEIVLDKGPATLQGC